MKTSEAGILPSCTLDMHVSLCAVRAAAHIVRDAPDETELLWRALYTYLPTLMVQRLPGSWDQERVKLVRLCKGWRVVQGEVLVRSICSVTDDLVVHLPDFDSPPSSERPAH